MGTTYGFRGLLSILLTAALLLCCLPLNTAALELQTDSTQPSESETIPAETVPAEVDTEPDSAPIQTLPEETEPEETRSGETVPGETQPEETVPEQASPTVVTIARAKAMAEGAQRITVEGTVVHHTQTMTVLQDETGGIRLFLPPNLSLTPGQVLQVTGSRTAEGLYLSAFALKGTAPLPEEEASAGSLPEYRRVKLSNATYASGTLTQNGIPISLAYSAPEGITNEDTVTVRGVMAKGWFYADTMDKTEAAPEPEPEAAPVVTAVPSDGQLLPGEAVGLFCETEGASIYYSYSYDGSNYTDFFAYSGGIPADRAQEGLHVRAYAVTAGGTAGPQTDFYFTWQKGDTEDPAGDAPGTGDSNGYQLYFGLLHAHSSTPDGSGTVAKAFTHAAAVEGLDFFAITDNSTTFDHSEAGAILTDGTAISQRWTEGKAAAAAVTNDRFVGIFGYEMSWEYIDQLGHISTFHTPGWQSVNQPGFSTLERYYQALASAPGSISQFNHPGAEYGTFEAFSHYSPQYDARIQLLEVGSEDGCNAYDSYWKALDAGWHLAPSNNQANRNGNWGSESGARTVVLADSLTEQSLYDAIAQYRVYATEDPDLEIRYTLNGQVMGAILTAPTETVTICASLRDLTALSGGTVQVITENGTLLAQQNTDFGGEMLTFSLPGSYRYYYLRILRGGEIIAVTAPVWVTQPTEAGIESVTADTRTPAQGQQVTLTLIFYNREPIPVPVETLEVRCGGQVLYSAADPLTIPAQGNAPVTIPISYNGSGPAEFLISAALSGVSQLCTETLTLNYLTQSDLTVSTIAGVRSGITGQLYRVKGCVTAGNSNPYTTFPGTIYLQDSTGGIAVTAFTGSGIQVGAPLEVTGYLSKQEGNPVLELLDYSPLSEAYYRYVPQTLPVSTAMNVSTYGAQLVQLEGQVVSLMRTADGMGISRFTLKDAAGDTATVRIDSTILSGTYGTNQLTAQVMAGKNVRVIGLVHQEADGTVVLRVRNCDEVVYVSALSAFGGAAADLTNPKTGVEDFKTPFGAWIPTPLLLTVLLTTAAGLAALLRLKKQGAGK